MSWRDNWRQSRRKPTATRTTSARRKAPAKAKGKRSGSWFSVRDNLGLSKKAKQFIEKKLNFEFNTDVLREFKIRPATWSTRKYLGMCSTTKRGRRATTKIWVGVPKIGRQGYRINHQGGKQGVTVKDADEAAVVVAMHEAQHIRHHHGEVPTKQKDWEPEADDVGFAALKEYRQTVGSKPKTKGRSSWRIR